MRDKIKNLLSQEDQDQIDYHIVQIEAIVAKKLAALKAAERAKYGRINEKTKLLVNTVYEFRQNQPNLSSPDVDWDEFISDYHARKFLETRSDHLSSIVYRMQSAKILHDSDNYEDSLKDYGYSKYKNKSGADGYTIKVNEIKQFFNRTGTASKNKKKER